MDLYIARHGEAGSGTYDELRELTANGISTTQSVYTRSATSIHQSIATVICSPLLRARQTAEVALDLLPIKCRELVVSEILRPESCPEDIAGFLDKQTQWPILIVGHQPVLGELLAWLTDQEHFRAGIATSSLYALNLITPARGCGTVLWQS